jgi:hypothetical protein
VQRPLAPTPADRLNPRDASSRGPRLAQDLRGGGGCDWGVSHDGPTGKEADEIYGKRVAGKPTNRFSKRSDAKLDEVVRIVTRLNEPDALLAPAGW